MTSLLPELSKNLSLTPDSKKTRFHPILDPIDSPRIIDSCKKLLLLHDKVLYLDSLKQDNLSPDIEYIYPDKTLSSYSHHTLPCNTRNHNRFHLKVRTKEKPSLLKRANHSAGDKNILSPKLKRNYLSGTNKIAEKDSKITLGVQPVPITH